jgi:hypothetical protein
LNVQVNSSTEVKQHSIAEGEICIVLRPDTAGERLKWNVTERPPEVIAESAGMLFTVKPPGATALMPSQLTSTLKSVGGVVK